MNLIKKTSLFPLFFSLTFLLFGCQKNIDEDVELDLDTEIIIADANVGVTVSEIDNIADQAEVLSFVSKKTYDITDVLNDCATVEKDDTLFGNNYDTLYTRVSFGEVECEGIDGRKRKGKIEIMSVYNKLGFRKFREINTENYHVQGKKVRLQRKLEYDTLNDLNQFVWKLIGNVEITYSNNEKTTVDFDKKYTLVSGGDTPLNLEDDELQITGSENGIRKNGKNFTNTIIEPLKVSRNCRYVKEGKIKFEIENEIDFVLDYGAGSDCDNKVDILYGDQKEVIELD